MIQVKLNGGLGNQMFQYAAARSLAIRNNCSLILDISAFTSQNTRVFELGHFNVKGTLTSRWTVLSRRCLEKIRLIKASPLFREPHFQFADSFFKQPVPITLEGYWQSEKYFHDIREQLIFDFTLLHEPSRENAEILQLIRQAPSVSLHIRRGDYLSNPEANAFHGVLPLTYYANAIAEIKKITKNPNFFVFSDDPEWVLKNLHLDGPTQVVSHNSSHGYEDLRLMQNCQYNVIANSSFSWWAAWLNNHPQKLVYAPDRWFQNPNINTYDLIPNSWQKISIL